MLCCAAFVRGIGERARHGAAERAGGDPRRARDMCRHEKVWANERLRQLKHLNRIERLAWRSRQTCTVQQQVQKNWEAGSGSLQFFFFRSERCSWFFPVRDVGLRAEPNGRDTEWNWPRPAAASFARPEPLGRPQPGFQTGKRTGALRYGKKRGQLPSQTPPVFFFRSASFFRSDDFC